MIVTADEDSPVAEVVAGVVVVVGLEDVIFFSFFRRVNSGWVQGWTLCRVELLRGRKNYLPPRVKNALCGI